MNDFVKSKKNIEFEFKRVKLRTICKDDIEYLRQIRNMPVNRKWFIYQGEISSEQQLEWYLKYKCKDDDYTFIVSLSNDKENKPIGCVSIYNIDYSMKTAEFGRIIIDKTNLNEKGLGFDTTMASCEVACSIFGINKLYLQVFKNNISAIKTYEKSGFISESSKSESNLIYMYKFLYE